MAFYMFTGRYDRDSIKAMVASPQDRWPAAEALAQSLGGKLHHLFFTFGSDDFIAIFEAPDDATAAALSMVLGASGALSAGRTTRLLTSAEAVTAMSAAKAAVSSYKPATG